MPGIVLSTNRADPAATTSAMPAGRRASGILKTPVPDIEVFSPGPSYGDGSGVRDDLVGDSRHHGGAQKAVYAYAREELDFWGAELGRRFDDGRFGENLTTSGLDLERLRIDQQVRLGDVVLEVSVPRSPCATFAAHIGVPGWVRRFTERGRCGVYLRVVTPGRIEAGIPWELGPVPDHGVDMRTAFAAAMGDGDAATRVVAAHCLPAMYHDRLVERLAARGKG